MDNQTALFQFVAADGIAVMKNTTVEPYLVMAQGTIILSEHNKKAAGHKLMIDIKGWTDVEVTDMETEEKILYPNRNDILGYRKPFLFYGLTLEYEFLAYISLDKMQRFCLICELQEHQKCGTTAGIEMSEYYKAYIEFKKLMGQLLNGGYLYTFTLNEGWNVWEKQNKNLAGSFNEERLKD